MTARVYVNIPEGNMESYGIIWNNIPRNDPEMMILSWEYLANFIWKTRTMMRKTR